jgi:Spy/CpxP family protein refolding chaperone
MKIVGIAALSVALLVGGAAAGYAQGGQQSGAAPSGMRGGNRMMTTLLEGITLTDAQKAKIDSISAKYRAEMPAFTPGTRPDSATMARRRELMQQETAEIRSVLTPEQQKVFDENVARMRERMQRRGGPNG